MPYVDGFVIPVPKARLDDYKEMAQRGSEVWLEHGATHYVECIGDDVPMGEITSFPRAVQAKEDEVIIFSWIIYEDKAARDATMKKVMEDPRLADYMTNMPFDGKRMIFGGFIPFIQK
jgi:uncharacterized protein YbaA (DUF1428 family)